MTSRNILAAIAVTIIVTLAACATPDVTLPRGSDGGARWQALPVDLGPVEPGSGGLLVGHERNPQATLPVDQVRGRWVRFSATIERRTSGIGLRINASSSDRRTFSIPSICEERSTMSRCNTVLWVPFDVEKVSVVAWAAQEPGRVFEPRVEVATRPATGRSIGPRVDWLMALVRAEYYLTDEVEWPVVQRTIASIPAPPEDLDPTPAIAEYLRSLLPGNKHVFVWLRSLTTAPASTVPLPTCSSTPDGIGILGLPGLSQTSGDAPSAYAAVVHDCLMTGSTERAWIVDLRGNTGGNMYPMIGGLAPLLPIGRLYAFANGHRETTADVSVDRRGVTQNGKVLFEALDAGSRSSTPVIVVFGAQCASSCEQTANALAARPRTLFIGEASGGYLTGNIVVPVNNEYVLLLTSGYTQDPCGQIIERLVPDVAVPELATRTIDELLDQAEVRSWLVARWRDPNENRARTTGRCAAAAGASPRPGHNQ